MSKVLKSSLTSRQLKQCKASRSSLCKLYLYPLNYKSHEAYGPRRPVGPAPGPLSRRPGTALPGFRTRALGALGPSSPEDACSSLPAPPRQPQALGPGLRRAERRLRARSRPTGTRRWRPGEDSSRPSAGRRAAPRSDPGSLPCQEDPAAPRAVRPPRGRAGPSRLRTRSGPCVPGTQPT